MFLLWLSNKRGSISEIVDILSKFYLYSTLFGIIGVVIPAIFIPYFNGIFRGIFIVVMLIIAIIVILRTRKYINKRQKSLKDWSSFNIPSSKNKVMTSMEEKYYYRGKTNQQLHHYNEALNCYSKSLEFNPDFEPAKNAKEEILKMIEN